MREIEASQYKELLNQLLGEIVEVCEREHITYYLAYGTLLGAVRHHGFIPWDDDLDIYVPIEDYPRLLHLLRKRKDRVVLDYQDGSFWLNFGKYGNAKTLVVDNIQNGKPKKRGVSVDIFPLIGCRKIGGGYIYRLIGKMRSVLWLYEGGYSLRTIEAAAAAVCSAVGMNEAFWRKRLQACEASFADDTQVGHPVTRQIKRDVHPKVCFHPAQMMFEGSSRCIPSGYDQVLSNLYGSYMTLPPEAQRVKTHHTKVFWIE